MSVLWSLLPLPATLVYCVGLIICWRIIAGHIAWAVHRSATTNKTVRPPMENWIAGATLALPLAVVWFLTLIFVIPWPMKLTKGDEAKGEQMVRGLKYAELTQFNQDAEKRLGIGEIVD